MNVWIGFMTGGTGLRFERTGFAPDVTGRKMMIIMQDSFFILNSLSLHITA
jgi:hypothetical protein